MIQRGFFGKKLRCFIVLRNGTYADNLYSDFQNTKAKRQWIFCSYGHIMSL